MTKPTPHGQVPEALIDLIDAYAETRHRCGGVYNAKTEAARNAVIEALSGVQALSAAPADIAKLRHLYANLKNGGVRDAAQAKRIADGLLAPIIERLEQAALKAAPEVGNSGFDYKTAADFLNNKTVSDEAVRAFVAASRWAHDERAALSATLLAMHGVLTSREAEIALLKKALMEAEAAPKQEVQEPTQEMVDAVMSLVDLEVSDPEDHRYDDGSKLAAQICRAVLALAPQQEAQEPCPTCAALARTVMLDQVSFDRKPDCYGIRQITDDEGVEEWEDIRTSPDVAREEANDMMATGRGEIYEVAPLWTTPQPAPAPLSEREAFEAWIEKDGGDLGTFGTPPNMHYRNSSVNNAWVAWKARAALAAQGGKA